MLRARDEEQANALRVHSHVRLRTYLGGHRCCSLHHENICGFYGFCTKPRNLLVLELMFRSGTALFALPRPAATRHVTATSCARYKTRVPDFDILASTCFGNLPSDSIMNDNVIVARARVPRTRNSVYSLMNDDTAPLRFALEHTAVLTAAALDVARGMEYLHAQSPAILHRDLKCLNILCSEGARLRRTASDSAAKLARSDTSAAVT